MGHARRDDRHRRRAPPVSKGRSRSVYAASRDRPFVRPATSRAGSRIESGRARGRLVRSGRGARPPVRRGPALSRDGVQLRRAGRIVGRVLFGWAPLAGRQSNILTDRYPIAASSPVRRHRDRVRAEGRSCGASRRIGNRREGSSRSTPNRRGHSPGRDSGPEARRRPCARPVSLAIDAQTLPAPARGAPCHHVASWRARIGVISARSTAADALPGADVRRVL